MKFRSSKVRVCADCSKVVPVLQFSNCTSVNATVLLCLNILY